MQNTQKVTTPPIALCAKCGAKAKCFDDCDYRWRVICNNHHTATKVCGSRHRAICRWNNAQEKLHKLNLQQKEDN
jgi:hypothetical protein